MEIHTPIKKTKKALITFSGIDGSGKTSIVNEIARYIPESKVIHIIQFRLINKIFIKKNKSKRNHDLKNKSIIGLVNIILLYLDAIIFKIFFILSDNNLILDRYFYDLIASHNLRHGNSKLLNPIYYIIPAPTIAFYITVESKVAQKREKEDMHSIHYFHKLKKIFKKITLKHGLIEIHNSNLNDTLKEIKKIINHKKL
jgi:thymidylate kinase